MSVPIYHMVSGAPQPVAPYSHVVEADGAHQWSLATNIGIGHAVQRDVAGFHVALGVRRSQAVEH